jgi:hypothetical protein
MLSARIVGRATILAAFALVLLCMSPAAGGAAAPKFRDCDSSPPSKLTSRGVKCGRARAIAEAALRKSNCPQRRDFRGCYKPVEFNGWTCRGLFPGEGWSFTCRKESRSVSYSGGA